MNIIKSRLSDQVFQEIKRMIAEGNFVPGDKFYSENELTKMLKVSRSSLREAIRLLEVSGFVSVQHGKGIFISDPSQQGQRAFGDWLKENETNLIEHFEIRLIIDPKAAAAAAVKADEQDILKLTAICEEFKTMAATGNTTNMIAIDEAFHLQLAKSTKNRTLYMMMKTMTQSLTEGWISSLHIPGRIQKTVQEHQDIVEAIKMGNPQLAEKRMAEHLAKALKDIQSSLQGHIGGSN